MTDVSRFYNDVIDDVINGVKDEWVEEGLDLQVLDELQKLWTRKLNESRVCDPEPPPNTAAQYLNLIQRSQLQLRTAAPVTLSHSNIAVPVRPLNPVAPHSIGLPGALASLRPPVARAAGDRVQIQPNFHSITQAQRLPPQHALLHGGIVSGMSATPGAQLHVQQPRPVVPTAIQSTGAPQIAALPSGLTGHLVQIGQQTYLVPQTLVGLRQPVGASQLSIPQFVGASTASTTSVPVAASSDPSSFSQTQVDGGHDSEDKYAETPSSHQPTPGRNTGTIGTDRTEHPSDVEDDDDEDDDDFVAATPGFTPSSVRSSYHQHPMHSPVANNNGARHENLNNRNSLNSGPPTPATPLSVAPRTPFDVAAGWRRSTPGGSGTPARKRRRRSPFHAADTDTEVDDYDEDDGSDVGEEVELMTNATMTPAVHGDLEDEDEVHVIKPSQSPRRTKRSDGPNRDGSRGASANLLSPSSQLGDAPPDLPDPGADSEMLHGDEEEEEEDDPLNSEDDVSDEEPEVLFESDNVVVCQYDKIHRSRNRWRFHLKDGIMAINGRDHVFQKAVGEAEW